MRTALLLALCLIAAAMAGCASQLPHDHWNGEKVEYAGVVYRMEYTLATLDGNMRAGPEAPHCPTAWWEDNRLNLFRGSYEKLASEPVFVVVQQRLMGDWASYGSAAYPASLPLNITSASINETLIALDWQDGNVTIEGETHPAPHTWMKENDEDGWRLTASIFDTTSRLEILDPGQYLCD